ncbi:MAG: hypothetical protein ACKVI3_20970 [Verrucomicrobiia bacterium]
MRDWRLPIWVRPRFDDGTYAKLDHDRLPLLLDWLDQTVAHLKERQLKQENTPMVHSVRHARLLRVMAGISLREDKSFPAAAVLVGFVQLSLDVAWGEREAGDVVELILVGTDRGYFLIDPATRTMRPYDKNLQGLTKWVHL